jgi:hypothetical protein
MATVMQKIKDIEDEVMMMRITFFPFLSSGTHDLVFAFECSFVFFSSQILNSVFLSCRCCYCCCFCFSFLLVVEGMRRDGCDGERERILRVEAECRWPRRKRTRPQLII